MYAAAISSLWAAVVTVQTREVCIFRLPLNR